MKFLVRNHLRAFIFVFVFFCLFFFVTLKRLWHGPDLSSRRGTSSCINKLTERKIPSWTLRRSQPISLPLEKRRHIQTLLASLLGFSDEPSSANETAKVDDLQHGSVLEKLSRGPLDHVFRVLARETL